MCSRLSILIFTLIIAPLCWGQGADRINRAQNPTTVIGPRNVPLAEGAKALIADDAEEGVRLTLEGLKIAHGRREEEAALSNLCAEILQHPADAQRQKLAWLQQPGRRLYHDEAV